MNNINPHTIDEIEDRLTDIVIGNAKFAVQIPSTGVVLQTFWFNHTIAILAMECVKSKAVIADDKEDKFNTLYNQILTI